MKLEEAVSNLPEGKFRVLMVSKDKAGEHFLPIEDYGDFGKAAFEAKYNDRLAKERGADVYFVIAINKKRFVFPD